MRQIPKWCGIVVAVSWVLMIGHACWIYEHQQHISPGVARNPCNGEAPPSYRNRLMTRETSKEIRFVTFDTATQIAAFYYQSAPEYLHVPLDQSFRDPNETEFFFPNIVPSCSALHLVVYEYGLFRITRVYYFPWQTGQSGLARP